MAVTPEEKRYAARIVRQLAADYPDAECSLDFKTPLQLLVATILSAQCTDDRVNKVTPALFKQFPKAADYADAKLKDLEQAIQSTGFFRNKAKNIQACCKKLVEEHDGKIPQELDDLVALPGVGRKTANVVLGTAFRVASGVVVDTHVARISYRLGLSSERKNAVKIEQDLIALLPKRHWVAFSHRLILHGRKVCAARKPKCDICSLAKWCPRTGVDT